MSGLPSPVSPLTAAYLQCNTGRLLAAAALVALLVIAALRLPLGSSGGKMPLFTAGAGLQAAASASSHPLFSQVSRDLKPFRADGISLQAVDQVYCQGSRSSFRVQVVNGSAYIVEESPSWQSRIVNIKRQLLQLWVAGGMPDGVDFVVEQEDAPTAPGPSEDCPKRGPLLAPAKAVDNPDHSHVLLAPGHSFGGWHEVHTLEWAEMQPLLQKAAERQPWEQRDGRLFWRGAATGARHQLDRNLSGLYPTLLDVQLMDWGGEFPPPGFVSLADHCRRKALLHLPGNTYSARLKYLLACGSAVVMPSSPWREFYYHLLTPGQNVLVTDPVDPDNGGRHFADVAGLLQRNDDMARRLGTAAAELAQEALAPAMVQAYWQHLLQEYRQLQTFDATLHPDAVPLEQSILVPQILEWSQRTCPVCHATGG